MDRSRGVRLFLKADPVNIRGVYHLSLVIYIRCTLHCNRELGLRLF